nr:hypothetical protein [uncultured Arsenicibacter sp.]
MTTAQILFEQYKVLPSRVKRELKEMIIQEEAEDVVPLKDQIKEGLKEIKLIKEGKLKAKSADVFLAELRQELANED